MPPFFLKLCTPCSPGCQLKQLDALADKAQTVTKTSLLDQQIAFKHKAGGNIKSNICFTNAGVKKTDKAGKASAAQNIFPQANKSPIASMAVVHRPKQSHPGNGKHVPWQMKTLCQFCNVGYSGKQSKLSIQYLWKQH